ncbi:MAG TPA: hypothetical protein VJX74_16145 [Blastocatellia bacterium]|nr:hypothetical protein [Blastocatellia bacterium]
MEKQTEQKKASLSGLPTSKGLRSLVQEITEKYLAARGLSVVSKAIIPASYVSGNPPIQQGHETSTSFGAKTHKIVVPFGLLTTKPTASDAIVFGSDADGNRVIVGKVVDANAAVSDSISIAALRPVEPGNTVLLAADTEQSTTSNAFVEVKRFKVSRPGRYRVKLELARSGGTAQAVVKVRLLDGSLITATSTASQNTLTYPTFGAVQSFDMTISADWGSIISVYLLNDSGPAQTAYIRNVRLCYTDIISALVPHDVILLD